MRETDFSTCCGMDDLAERLRRREYELRQPGGVPPVSRAGAAGPERVLPRDGGVRAAALSAAPLSGTPGPRF